MNSLNVLTTENASSESVEIFEALKNKFGSLPNIYAVAGNSPIALKALLDFADTLSSGEFSASEIEAIALVVAEENGCNYCLAAHTTVGKMAGLSEDETLAIRSGKSSDTKLNALVALAKEVVVSDGWPNKELVEQFFTAGYNKAALVELIGFVAANIFRNYLNHIADTPVDFPETRPLEEKAVA